jgi:hypothetical protein
VKRLFGRVFLILALSAAITITAIQAPSATLLVRIGGPEWRLGELTEGAMGYFRILRKGEVFLERTAVGRPNGFRALDLGLPPGDYELVSYVCGPLMKPFGPPLDECRGSFSVRDGEVLYVSRKQTPGDTCSLFFSTTKPTPPENRR